MRLFEPETELRKARKACNLTQAKLARRTGYSRETISRIESGQRKMSRAFRDILLREEVLGKHLPQEAGLGDAPGVICPLLSGPKLMIFWITKETWNAEQEASPGRDYRQAA